MSIQRRNLYDDVDVADDENDVFVLLRRKTATPAEGGDLAPEELRSASGTLDAIKDILGDSDVLFSHIHRLFSSFAPSSRFFCNLSFHRFHFPSPLASSLMHAFAINSIKGHHLCPALLANLTLFSAQDDDLFKEPPKPKAEHTKRNASLLLNPNDLFASLEHKRKIIEAQRTPAPRTNKLMKLLEAFSEDDENESKPSSDTENQSKAPTQDIEGISDSHCH